MGHPTSKFPRPTRSGSALRFADLFSADRTNLDLNVGAHFNTLDLAIPNPQDTIRNIQHLMVVSGGNNCDSLLYICLLYTSDAADE